ncbi:hypothetical protein [Nocardiopsis synnemataformans]|uniref:hypothetical protein n=1 Tax=Nocardiopsis synnemataformans TaxID=61305 RepID=UPI003EB9E0E4
MTAPAAPELSPGMRRVLDAPRGQRFSRPTLRPGIRPTTNRPPASPPPLTSLGRTPRERALLAQMPDTPRLRYRLTHGDVPAWMMASDARDPRPRERPAPVSDPGSVPGRKPAPAPKPVPNRKPAPAPKPTPAPGDGPRPKPLPIPRPRRERTPPPPLPRRSDRPRRPASHRRPRRRAGWTVTCYALAASAGALAHHLTQLLV